MRIDLPVCGFKTCRYSFDCNCTDKNRYETCEFQKVKTFHRENRWISLRENQPKMDIPVILSTVGGQGEGYRIDLNKYRLIRYDLVLEDDDVYAWKPMPERYKEE